MIDDERQNGDEARQAAAILERKRIALNAELDDIRSLIEAVWWNHSNLFDLNKHIYDEVVQQIDRSVIESHLYGVIRRISQCGSKGLSVWIEGFELSAGIIFLSYFNERFAVSR